MSLLLIIWAVTATYGGPMIISGKAFLSGNGVYIAPPVASFTVSTSSGDPSLSVTFTDTSTSTPTSWNWNFGDGNTSTSQNPTHSFASGSWSVVLTAVNAGGQSTATTNIVVNYLADVFVDFHGGTSGQAFTTNLLTASSYISSGFSGCYWTLHGGQSGTNLATATAIFFTNLNATLPAPVKVDGVSHDGNNGIGMEYFFNGAFEQYAQLNFPDHYPNISAQCIMSFGEANGNWFDHGVARSVTNSSVQCSFPNFKSVGTLQTESCPSPSPCNYGDPINISRNTNYRVVFKWVSGDGGYMKIYDMSGALIGSSYSSNNGIAGGMKFFQIGIPSSSDGGNTIAFWDSLAIKFDSSLYQ